MSYAYDVREIVITPGTPVILEGGARIVEVLQAGAAPREPGEWLDDKSAANVRVMALVEIPQERSRQI